MERRHEGRVLIMPITFTNKSEALEYSDKMRREGHKTKIAHRGNKFIVSLTGEQEVYHLTTIDLGEEVILQPHSYYGEYGLGGHPGEKPKVSFAPTPRQSLGAMPDIELEEIEDVEGRKFEIGKYHVYSPQEEIELTSQTKEEDFTESGEIASYKPVKARRIGKIVSRAGKHTYDFDWEK